jgi:hypothetical protein
LVDLAQQAGVNVIETINHITFAGIHNHVAVNAGADHTYSIGQQVGAGQSLHQICAIDHQIIAGNVHLITTQRFFL